MAETLVGGRFRPGCGLAPRPPGTATGRRGLVAAFMFARLAANSVRIAAKGSGTGPGVAETDHTRPSWSMTWSMVRRTRLASFATTTTTTSSADRAATNPAPMAEPGPRVSTRDPALRPLTRPGPGSGPPNRGPWGPEAHSPRPGPGRAGPCRGPLPRVPGSTAAGHHEHNARRATTGQKLSALPGTCPPDLSPSSRRGTAAVMSAARPKMVAAPNRWSRSCGYVETERTAGGMSCPAEDCEEQEC
jgi:hypothetical protein